MKHQQALSYVGHCVNDALNVTPTNNIPNNARLIGWQCGFEPMFVAVCSYMDGVTVDLDDAAEIAKDYLEEIKWFSGEPTDPDYCF